MSTAKSMVGVLHGEVDLFHSAGRERFRLLEAVTKFSTEGFAPHQLLISTHGECGRGYVLSGFVAVFRPWRVLLVVRVVGRIDVNQFQVPTRVRASRRNE